VNKSGASFLFLQLVEVLAAVTQAVGYLLSGGSCCPFGLKAICERANTFSNVDAELLIGNVDGPVQDQLLLLEPFYFGFQLVDPAVGWLFFFHGAFAFPV